MPTPAKTAEGSFDDIQKELGLAPHDPNDRSCPLADEGSRGDDDLNVPHIQFSTASSVLMPFKRSEAEESIG